MAEDATATSAPANEGHEVEPAAQSQEPAQATPDVKPDLSPEDLKAALAKANAEAARYRVERNELRSDAEKYREIKESEKTELQRTQEALEAANAQARKLETDLRRSQVLSQYGISEDNADLLGQDPEKFEANAQKLASLQEEAAKKAAPPSDVPVESLRPGAGIGTPPDHDFGFPSNWPVSGPFANNN